MKSFLKFYIAKPQEKINFDNRSCLKIAEKNYKYYLKRCLKSDIVTEYPVWDFNYRDNTAICMEIVKK